MRKFVRGLICGMMVLTLSVPTGIIPNTAMERTVYAAEADTTVLEGRCGDNTKYTYDSGTNTLTISGTGEMWDNMNLPMEACKAKNLIIEKGVTTIGERSFEELEMLENVQIANTVTTIREYAFLNVKGTIEIPASVTKVERYAICAAKRIVVKGDVKGYEQYSIGNYFDTEEIVICGSAEDLGKATMCVDKKNTVITIAEGNKKCTLKNGCIVSSDGKEVYYYVSDATKVKIDDSVEKICDAAFYDMGIKEVTFGKGIKEIGNRAFQYNKIKKVKFPKSLKKIGEEAFYGNSIKTATFNKKATIGTRAFSQKTVIRNNAGIKKTTTTIYNSYVSSKKIHVNFSKISDVTGYQIQIKAGKKTYKYDTTKNTFKKALNKNIKKYYETVEDDYEDDSKVAITVTVKPYKIVKGKRVYGKNSTKSVLIWSE